jgi:hypothetical protein
VLCVLDSHLHKKRVEGLARTTCYDNNFAVRKSCQSGGLGIFQNNEVNTEFLPCPQHHIDATLFSNQSMITSKLIHDPMLRRFDNAL